MIRLVASNAGLIACLAFSCAATAEAADKWFLMGRHGECAEVASLKRKVPDLGEVRDPVAFAAFMRAKGHEVTTNALPVPKGKAQEVKVPAAELFLVFVTADLCEAPPQRPST